MSAPERLIPPAGAGLRPASGRHISLPASHRRLPLLALLVLLAGCAAPLPSPSIPPTLPADTAAPRPTLAATSAPLPTPGSTRAAELAVVYLYRGDVWLYDSGTPRALTSDGLSYDPLLSPDGRRVLFRHAVVPTEPAAAPFSLWVLDLETGRETALDLSAIPPYSTTMDNNSVLLPRFPLNLAWMPDGRGILFNTMVDYSQFGPGGGSPGDDLWLADATSGRVRNLFPRAEDYATFALSPDGQWILWSRPARIEAMRLATGERRTLLEFPAVLTYSEYSWLPEPRWLADSHSAHVAIAPADPMQSQTYTLWQLDAAAGTAQLLGQVEGTVFAWSPTGLSWSPDGRWLAYVGEQSGVMLATVDGSKAVPVARGVHPSILGWSPDGAMALYEDEQVLYGVVAGPQPEVRRLTARGEPRTVLWRGDTLLAVTDAGLQKVATDGSGVQNLQP